MLWALRFSARMESGPLISRPCGAVFGCFSCLRLRFGPGISTVGSPREAGLEPATEGKVSVTGRRILEGDEKEKHLG